MRIFMPSIDPTVYIDPGAHRPIILKLRSLRVAMAPTEALHLADLLVDHAEKELK